MRTIALGVAANSTSFEYMKKLLLTLLVPLLLGTGSAWAEWVWVAGSDAVDKYIDPSTIRKDGNLVKVWEINNLKQRHKDGELSRRIRSEYDCNEELYRFLSFSEHSGPMANGTTLYAQDFSRKPDTWKQIPPETLVEKVLKRVCE